MKLKPNIEIIGFETPDVCIKLWQAIAEREAAKIKRRRFWLRLLSILTFGRKGGSIKHSPAPRKWNKTGNAALISAAPELLEALECACAYPLTAAWFEKAQSAIAKAKGKTQTH
jgi:hypothetical protein